MFKYDNDILNKIRGEKTLEEIANELGISLEEANERIMNLKARGFMLKKKIYDNGKIRYIAKNHQCDDSCVLDIKLCDRSKFSAMLISDLHFGNELQAINYLEKVYDYMQFTGINIIINGGDLIDGTFSKGNQDIANPIKQLDFVLENHPFDKNILNLICLGNHDFTLYKYGVDLKKALEYSRYDLIPFGYGIGILNFGGEQIFIRHHIPEYSFEPIFGKLVLEGHKHKMALTNADKGFLVNIPTLSNLVLGKYELPGAMRMDLLFDDEGYINSGHFEQFILTDKIYTVNEAILDLSFLNHDYILEEEVIPKIKKMSIGQSQIEKFNKKWRR